MDRFLPCQILLPQKRPEEMEQGPSGGRKIDDVGDREAENAQDPGPEAETNRWKIRQSMMRLSITTRFQSIVPFSTIGRNWS